ncbi:MAG: cyclodeaminase/cyclohydrolase family protein [Terrisporobacter othiniensis]|uniref:Cyclodeaminase/cyclohydrolase family protein n=1 Tax=Terrisporobacter hibernicus TaxID=2813371 RepID=A0AAX2ZHA8_9FIRM|nr:MULTISPECIES: cyclodeaminase/cyclohydrolase family protein [Terrisporobacter]MBN9645682.1 cyclodeaminase/cyclohydrolase family protein [Terrisporobacter glycolicus]MDU4861669.1 cyclodeaminase/cyclohydrolase family protein [Terrisporobacter othiniensis]MDU6995322.1 cyclodeaminase/cyclohydrolase family protein [Terrisporobacter othiniensis]UEL47742.1 cyclodeaminase/cyclohydrolase family protein [Terrisporobacter hibernicus]HBI91528.1 methenyltetrahydrofolate cyclohydrolase [Terrisporobacter h
MLQDLTVKDFIDELGSNSPAPGGGSVSALSASIASTLVTMVLNLTIGKKEYMEYEDFIKDEIVKSLNHGENYKKEFLDLMEKDTSAFLSLMDAFKMPKNTEEEIQIRKEKIQRGNNEALEIPFEVSQKAYKLYNYIDIAAEYGNKNALSDTGVAALLVEAAVEGALLNVKINILGLKDEDRKKELTEKCEIILEKSKKRKERIINSIESQLK